jgi:hypothetical protein
MPTTMATSTEAPAGIASEAAVPAEPSPESNNAASPPFAAEEGTIRSSCAVGITLLPDPSLSRFSRVGIGYF